jgi:Protein of unknown function (DUF2786)
MQVIFTDCEHCGTTFSQPYDPGRRRVYCGDACKQAAYRRRKKNSTSGTGRQRSSRERAHSWREEYEQARRAHQEEQARRQREREEWEREQRTGERERARQRASGGYSYGTSTGQPPPHAGTSRPGGTWCNACGGIRGVHSFHHDNAAHDRARRRFEALHRKAASTTFTAEADACREKAEQLKTKYGL